MQSDESSQVSPPPAYNRLELGLLAALLLAGLLAISANHADADLWGHVQYGRDTLRRGVAQFGTYTYTGAETPWVNHENLSEIVMAVVSDVSGPVGLLVLKAGLGLLVLLLLVRTSRRASLQVVPLGVLLVIVALNLGDHWVVRPQLASYVGFAALLCLLEHCFQGWPGTWRRGAAAARDYSPERIRRLWLAPPLFLIWANAHGGFLAGMAVFSLYLLLRCVQAWWLWGRKSLPLCGRLAMIVAASAAATLINPYGPRLHQWLLHSLGSPRPEIAEWHPPSLTDPHWATLWLMLGLAICSLALTRKRRDLVQLIVLGLISWQALRHQRHIPFLALGCGFWLPVHLQSMWDRLFPAAGETAWKKWQVRSAAAGLILVLVALTGRLAVQLSDMPVSREEYPVSAIEFMQSNRLQGKLVVTYNWAQYALCALSADQPDSAPVQVGFDGRFRTCYPQHVIDSHFDLVLGDIPRYRHRGPASGPFDPCAALEYRQPDLALINRRQEHSVAVLQSLQPQWVLLYQDQVAQLWGRASTYDQAGHAQYLPPQDRAIGDNPQLGSVCWPALPGGEESVSALAVRK